MAATNKSYSSFDTSEFIDLDTALVEEELRSLGSTPEHAHRNYSTSESPFKFSLKSIDEKETERFRRSLVTPMSRYNTPEWRTRSKSPTGSYAESVALFKNLSNNNDHLDFVSTSDFNEFMNSYDDDLLSKQDLYSSPVEDTPPSSPFLHKLSKREETLLPNLRYTNTPRKSSFDASVQTSHEYIPTKKSTPSLHHAQRRQSNTTLRLQKDMERLTISKRQSVDSDALRKLKEQQQKKEEIKLKRHSTLTNTRTSSRITDTNKSSIHLQKPDRRRWSSYLPEEQPRTLLQTRQTVNNNVLETEKATATSYGRRRHTLSNSAYLKEEDEYSTKVSHFEERPYSDSLPSRHYTLKKDTKPRRQEIPMFYANNEEIVTVEQPPRRHRTLSNPLKERNRKLSNNSKYTSSGDGYKEVRFHPEEIVASHSSGLLSSSTTSSSHSGDRFYDPPSPPQTSKLQRRSIPTFMDTHAIDEQVRATEHRYSQYLSRQNTLSKVEEPRRQRVSSEDNEGYKYQHQQRRKSVMKQTPLSPSQIPVNTSSIARKERRLYRANSTEDVTESARKVLALVQQRRNNHKSSSVLQQLPSNYPKRRDVYYH